MSNLIDVSIVIAAWNAQNFILTAIHSALAQQDVKVEVLVVDDASTDATCAVVESVTDPRVKLIRSEMNGGPGAARNLGFAAAKGTWIAVLDSDDAMHENRLSTMLAAAPATADVIIDNFCESKGDSVISKPHYSSVDLPLGELSLSFLIKSNLVFSNVKSTGYVKPLFKREFVNKSGVKYWPEVRIGEDYYFLASCLARGANAQVLDQAGYIYTIRDGSISSKMEVAHIGKLLECDKRFIKEHQLSEAALLAQKIRSKNLLRAYHYLVIVDQIKKRKILAAFINMFLHPSSALLLSLPIKKRLFASK